MTDQTKEKVLKEDMVPTDRKGKILVINSTCDLTKVLKEFKNYLERNSHGAVMELEPDSFPHRPNEAYSRRDVPGWREEFTGDDQKAIDNYIRQNHYWQASINFAVTAFLNMFDVKAQNDLELMMGQDDINRMTRLNLFDMIDAVTNRWGGWTPNKGEKNYNDWHNIRPFTSKESARTALLLCKEKRTERNGWNKESEVFSDEMYKNWLVQRMKGCTYFDHMRNTFEDDVTLTFDVCQEKLTAKMAKDEDDENTTSNRQSGRTEPQSPVATYPRDTATVQYESNQAIYGEGFQGTALTASPAGRQEHMRRCFRCNQLGHVANRCPHFTQMQPQTYGVGQINGRSGPRQNYGTRGPGQLMGRGSTGRYTGRGTSSLNTAAPYVPRQTYPEQLRQPITIAGNKRTQHAEDTYRAKRQPPRDTWPMTGPGNLQATACMMDHGDEEADLRYAQSELEQWNEFQDFKAHQVRIRTGEYEVENFVPSQEAFGDEDNGDQWES